MSYEFEEYSWYDANGRLVKVPEDSNHVYRAVSENTLRIFKELADGEKLDLLISKGLIETEISQIQITGYAGVLKHRKIPFVSEPNEWTMQMHQKASLMLCQLAIELDKLGYALQDAHPWNVSFLGTQPVFFDWGSIIRREKLSKLAWLLEFRKHTYIPLWLHSKGLQTLAYESLWERRGGSAKYFFNHPYLRIFPPSFYLLLKNCGRWDFQKILASIIRMISKLNVGALPGFWSDYDQGSYAYKDDGFREFLDGLPERSSILDIGCNRGTYSIESSKAGHQVVAFDYDARAVDELFEIAVENCYDLTPLHIDLIRPTHSYGPDLSSPDIFERLRCHYVLAFAISHHLAKNYRITFETLARILSQYSRKGVLVEYVDPKDKHLLAWQQRGWQPQPWYNEQNFIDSFSKLFRLKKTWSTKEGDEIVRRLFFFEKK